VPELPEVEDARRVIARRALGRLITDVDDSDRYVTRPHAAGDLSRALAGRTLTAARRRGKAMWLETSPAGDGGPPGPDLGIHLGMSGRIVVTGPDGARAEGGDPPGYYARPHDPAWTRFRIGFADGGSLALVDPRRLGRVRLSPGISALGPDAAEVSGAQFRAIMGRGTAPAKARLLDQSRIAGIGNLLADEILWQARIPPLAPAGSLSPAEVSRLYRAMRKVLRAALADGGGAHTGAVIAARRPGGTCPRDGAPMAHGTVGGRSTWWCSREQALTAAPRGQPGHGAAG
jgi:formamidopyrimidine-DNA glycosylase